jgi:hypothetical protein
MLVEPLSAHRKFNLEKTALHMPDLPSGEAYVPVPPTEKLKQEALKASVIQYAAAITVVQVRGSIEYLDQHGRRLECGYCYQVDVPETDKRDATSSVRTCIDRSSFFGKPYPPIW